MSSTSKPFRSLEPGASRPAASRPLASDADIVRSAPLQEPAEHLLAASDDAELGPASLNDDSLTMGEGSESLGRRRGAGRRLSEFLKSAEDGQLTKEQFLFVMAIDAFKKSNRAPYPAWTDVLEVIRLLGYRKTMPSEVEVRSAEDWTENGSNSSGVRPERWQAWGKIDKERKQNSRKAA